jgi:two-component system chemotaxis response regulator CheB
MTIARGVRPIRAVIVDDSVLMRTMLFSALEVDGDIQVVGTAKDPHDARKIIKQTNPDVVTLDVEMPGMNGLDFLRKIMQLRPMPVVMVSSLTSEGAEATLMALELGAVDFAAKPAGGAGMRSFGDIVRQKVRAASHARVQKKIPIAAPKMRRSAVGGANANSLVAIGASTGGVAAIGSIVQQLPKGLPPIICVVHMPEKYTGRYARRLAQQTGHDVAEARDGEVLGVGAIRIARGGRHMIVEQSGMGYATRIKDGDPVTGHKPSIDVCFDSVAKAVGRRALGVILTGMGRDGAKGLLNMRQAGAIGLGEAESSCVVYGMPKAAREIGAVNEEHDIAKMPDRICELISRATIRV